MDRELPAYGVVSSEFFVSRKCRVERWRDSRDLLFQEWYLTQYHVTKVDPSYNTV